MKIRNKFLIILFSLSLYNCFAVEFNSEFIDNPNIVIFDIGGTLIETNSFSFLRSIGIMNLISFTCQQHSLRLKSKIADFYLDTLSKIPSPVEGPDYNVIGFNGKIMPPLQRDNMLGKLSMKQCYKIAKKWINLNSDQFKNKTDKNFFKKMLDLNFNRNSFITSQKYTKQIDLLKKVYDKQDKNGKRENFCIILSNQPKGVISLLKKHFPKIFQYSDKQIFSCKEGYLKPHKNLFEKCINLCPNNANQECYFIDDEKFNIQESSNLKIKSFNIIGLYPKEASNKLKEFNII